MDKMNNTICSSATEYLTVIAATGESDVNAIYVDEEVQLSQKMLGELYDDNVRTVSFKENIYG